MCDDMDEQPATMEAGGDTKTSKYCRTCGEHNLKRRPMTGWGTRQKQISMRQTTAADQNSGHVAEH
jgi:hypothetical protein